MNPRTNLGKRYQISMAPGACPGAAFLKVQTMARMKAARPMSTFWDILTMTPIFMADSLTSEPAATTDPLRREKQHNAGRGAAYTRMHRPVHLVFVEAQEDRSAAMRRERSLKRMTHQQKSTLAQTWGENHIKEGDIHESA